ncbi:MAG TPA: oligosaccharide flippase family protein [Candidatus Cloacimonadota bacterium]|nr:oligosaccharide flippase family protein [Candidatus Cloacimonadota bacterium]
MLKQKFVLSYSTQVVNQILQMVASIIVARIAGPSVLGTIAFGLAYVGMFGFIAQLGLGSAHMKMISEGKDLGNCISTYRVMNYFTTALFIVVTLGFLTFQKFILHTNFETSDHIFVVIVFTMVYGIQALLGVAKTTFSARIEQAKLDIPELVRNVLLQIGRITIVLIGLRTKTLAVFNLATVILVAVWITYLFKEYPRGNYDKELAKAYIKIGIPIVILGFASGMISNLDKVLLQFYTNSEQVGYYGASFRLGGFISVIGASIGMLFFPLFSKAAVAKDWEFIKSKISTFEKFSDLIVFPMVLFVAIYSDTIVYWLLGNKYLHSVIPLSLITFGLYINIQTMPYGNVIAGLGYFVLDAVWNIITVAYFVLVLILFIHPSLLNMAAHGAAIALLSTYIFSGIWNRYYAKRLIPSLNLTKNLPLVSLIFLIASVMFLVYRYVLGNPVDYFRYVILDPKVTSEMAFGSPGHYFRFVFPFLYFGLMYGVLWISKNIGKPDIQLILTLVSPRKLKNYVVSEIVPTSFAEEIPDDPTSNDQ